MRAETQPEVAQTPATPGSATAEQIYKAIQSQVQVLNEQLRGVRQTRNSITNELANDRTEGVDRLGLENRLKTVDARIADLDKQLAQAQAQQATAAAIPGAIVERPYVQDHRLHPDEVAAGAAMFMFAIMFPMAIAYSRRIWRRSAKMMVSLPPGVAERMQSMEEAIESVAVEVERIGEGQRFMTQALAESPRHLGAGAAEPIAVRARENVHAERSQ